MLKVNSHTNITPMWIYDSNNENLGVVDCIAHTDKGDYYAERFYGWQTLQIVCPVSEVKKTLKYNAQ